MSTGNPIDLLVSYGWKLEYRDHDFAWWLTKPDKLGSYVRASSLDDLAEAISCHALDEFAKHGYER